MRHRRLVGPELESRFRRYARLIAGKWFLNIAVYVDESSTSQWAGVAGYISTVERWDLLVTEWQTVLDKFKVHYFHFSEFSNLKNGPQNPNWKYRNLNPSERNEFLLQLSDIAGKHTEIGWGVFVDVKQYEKLMPIWYKERVRLPWGFCFDRLLSLLFTEVDSLSYDKEGEKVSFFFDRIDPKSNRMWYQTAFELYDAASTYRDPFRLTGNFTDGSTTKDLPDSIPLQAADLLVYRLRQVVENMFVKQMDYQNKPIDRRIGPNLHIEIHHGQSLMDTAKLIERHKAKTIETGLLFL